jgi:hypothetical protein
MDETVSLDRLMKLASRLCVRDKVRLIRHLAPQIERDLQSAATVPRRSLRGIWRGLDITEEDIAAARREMWREFPREDL